ncbi:MAG: glycosyltransferase [Candidatus Berkelbacteria bacterium]|nr:glycosyltransferase [Candidatus Berkelbacteria bacterium]
MNFTDKKIIISTHVYTTGPAQDLRDYLISQKALKLLYVGHPLFYKSELKGSGYELYYGNTGEKKENYTKIKDNFGMCSYFRDFFGNIRHVMKNGNGWDLYVGSDNLNALSGIVLRRLGYVKKCVYYVIDYNPHRFQNRLVNKIYHKIDQYCVKHCDETWNLSVRMEEGRKKYFNFSGGNQITFPIGIWFDKFNRVPFAKVEKQTLVYMGHVLKKQGIQYVIEATPAIIKKIPSFNFLIIGGGEYLTDLKNLADKLGVYKNLEFTGFVEDHRDVERMLSVGAAAVAMYEKYDDAGNLSFTYFADPGKLKSYLAGALPIILTDVSHNAKEIERLGCGKIITSDKESIAKAVIAILKNEKQLEKMHKNAEEYAKKYDWNLTFPKNLDRILKK